MDGSHPPKRLKRIAVFIPEDQHRQLTAKLALKGKKVAGWVRDKVQEELNL